jgi:membrane-bound lytic murein transglycosylase D
MNVFCLHRVLFFLLPITCQIAFAQQKSEIDSLNLIAEVKTDSVKSVVLSMPTEYIPGDDTPELVADRLSCLQKTIALPYNDKVHAFINYFTVRDRDYTRMILRRRQLYFPLFEKHLSDFNLPIELKYLSVIESGLNPRAVSGARAVGLWQFMSATGKYFNLNNDVYEDDRMDPEKSTIAACRYLSQLYSIFHDWHLALAAYNSGPGTVSRAIKRSGGKRSFWEIYDLLPAETRSYVPQYIAIVYALNHAEDHNIIEHYQEENLPNDTLLVTKYLHFETLANLTGTCKEDLQKLNPAFHRGVIPDGKSAIMRLPLLAKRNLNQNRFLILDSASKVGRQELDESLKSVIGSTYGKEKVTYRVRSGEALGTIANKFAVRVEDIKKWNNLNTSLIHPGKGLSIWVVPGRKNVATSLAKIQTIIDKEGKTYTVQPGDTLWEITRKFNGLTVEKIKSLNKMKSVKLQPGQKLIVG